ncbi:adhesion G protein-coupled receptor L2-like [Hydractinia symbiolongicarpus]|uniref:adhesion G protein-coupled receptor L2-like n=1 Tax=Hydractinia symbiolongicarpus TaxID=13093 RepID=UPI00254D9F0A|nr:adhesion G protein-coupled receptor L2-like [Hydractinia symbiolongicarpus]
MIVLAFFIIIVQSYFTMSDARKSRAPMCKQHTGITIVLDNTRHVSRNIHELEKEIERKILLNFQSRQLQHKLGDYTNNVFCSGDGININDDAYGDSKSLYKMECARQLLTSLEHKLTSNNKGIDSYLMNIALSLSVSKWLPQYITQRYSANESYLVVFLNSTKFSQQLFSVGLVRDVTGKFSLDGKKINKAVTEIMQKICPNDFPSGKESTTTAITRKATARTAPTTTMDEITDITTTNNTTIAASTTVNDMNSATPITTQKISSSRPFTNTNTLTSNSDIPLKPSTTHHTNATSVIKPTTAATTSKAITIFSTVDPNVLKQDVEQFLTQNITEAQLSNTSWAQTFLQASCELLKKVSDAEKEVKGEKLLQFMERTLLKVGSKLVDGVSLTLSTDDLVAEVQSINRSEYRGYEFPTFNITSSETTLYLPGNLLKETSADKIALLAMKYKPLKAMKREKKHFSLSNDVISITLDPPVKTPFKELLNYTMRRRKNNFTDHQCVFWNTRTRIWDTTGCFVSKITDDHVTCQCNHMTSFSILMQVEDFELSDKHHIALMVITYVGCGVSAASCLCLIFIYIFLRRMLKIDRNVIHVNLAVAIAISNALFLSADSLVDRKDLCLGISISMLYFYLATFFWMLVEGVHVYLMIFKVFKSKKRMPIYLLIGWVPPGIITAGTALKFTDLMTTGDFCWVSTKQGIIWTFVGPALFVMSVNTVILCMTLKTSQRIKIGTNEVREIRRIARLTIVLMPIFGISWIFGIFAVNKETIAFQYVFTILNVFQGLFIFIGYGIMNNEVRREVSRKKHMSESADIRRSTSTARSKKYNAVFCNAAFSTNENNSIKNKDVIQTPTSRDYDDVFTDTSSPYSINDEFYRSSMQSSYGSWMYGDFGSSPGQSSMYSLGDESYRSTKFLTLEAFKV